MIKLCCCRGAHVTHSQIQQDNSGRYCPTCGMYLDDMQEAAPDAFGRFERGDLIIRWMPDGSVNLVDVGEPLMARTCRP